MDTNLLKKGRSAVAIVLSLALVLTTATFPVSIAKAVTPTIPVTISDKIEAPFTDSDLVKADIQYILPVGTNYVFIKQGSSENVLWSAETLSTDQLNAIKAQLTGKADSLDSGLTLIVGYDILHEIDPAHGSNYTYQFTLNANGTTTFTFKSDKVSHFFYGHVGTPEYEITVTKAVTLNGEVANPLLNTTFYVSLFDANGKVAGTLTQPIVIESGVIKNTVTFKVTDKTKTYYIYETDANGQILNPGIDIEGYYLQSITNQGDPITVVSTTVPATRTITNNLVDREPDTIPVEIQKSLIGMDLTAEQFSFTLVESTSDWIALDEATPDIEKNDLAGKVIFDDLEFDEEGTFYYIIFENIPKTTDADWMNGMLYDSHVIHLTIEVSEEGEAYYAEVESMTGSSTFTNTQEYGQIKVIKEVEWTEDSVTTTPINKTFRAGLFVMVDDEYELVQIDEEDAIVELKVENSAPVEATFEDLPLNQTYYVFEIDENDLPLVTDGQGNFPGVTSGWIALKYTTNPIELIPRDKTGEITITNYFEDFEAPYEAGEITVTKVVTVMSGDTKVTHVFYVALFEDQDGKMVKVTGVEPLSIVGSVSTSVTFMDLDLDKTYHVYETDAAGNIIQTIDDKIVTPSLKDWTKIVYTTPMITLTLENQTGRATINNVFEPKDLFFDPSIKVIKSVTVNNKPTASNLTFYAGLFEDKELTKLIAFKPLAMKGGTTADASFAFYQDGVTPLKVGTTYYIAETDKDGKPLTGTAKELGFDISINGVTNNNATVVLIEEEAIVNIVNNFKKEEFPLTGDNSNMSLWLFLAMLGVAGAIAPFAFRKKEEAND